MQNVNTILIVSTKTTKICDRVTEDPISGFHMGIALNGKSGLRILSEACGDYLLRNFVPDGCTDCTDCKWRQRHDNVTDCN
jgi:hypothetical protein